MSTLTVAPRPLGRIDGEPTLDDVLAGVWVEACRRSSRRVPGVPRRDGAGLRRSRAAGWRLLRGLRRDAQIARAGRRRQFGAMLVIAG